MNRNYIFRNSTEALPRLLADLTKPDISSEVGSRAGRTMELTHVGITLTHPLERELLVLGRKPSIAAQIAETMWVLSGRNDIEWLSRYLPRAADFSDDGKTWRAGYGPRIRKWQDQAQRVRQVDQLEYVVETLRASALTRQAVISIWDPVIDTQPGKDIPCNDWITFSNRDGRLDMHVGIRSNDAMWGWSGINAFEWSVLLEVVATLVGVQVGRLHFSTTSFHLYERHWERAQTIVDSSPWKTGDATWLRMPSPRFDPQSVSVSAFDDLLKRWFEVEEMIRVQTGQPVDHLIESFPEPMLRSWLRVIAWWWRKHPGFITPISDTDLGRACQESYSLQPKKLDLHVSKVWSNAEETAVRSPFIVAATRLHLEKHEAYGDSWKKRGEQVSILANIARKVDRLGGAETSDETSADTAMDLMIYLAKYRDWLDDVGRGGKPSNPYLMWSEDPVHANERLLELDDRSSGKQRITNTGGMEDVLKKEFEELFQAASQDEDRYPIVDRMLAESYELARVLWERENAMTDAASVGGGMPGSWTDEYQGADHD